jgi:RNA polymerase sigma factor (sigma-70 family)
MSEEVPRAELRGDEGALYVRLNSRLRRAITFDVNTSTETIEDSCAFAWAQFIVYQPRRESALSWLCKVAKREAFRLDRLERRVESLDREAEVRAATDATTASNEPEAQHRTIETAHRLLEVQERLEALPEREREVAFLRAAGFHYSELAEHLGVSYTRVNQLLARGDQRMRERDLREQTPCSARAELLRQVEEIPPSYVLAAIGRPPNGNPKRGSAELRLEWRRLALAIEDYRADRGVKDRVLPLGQHGTGGSARAALELRIALYREARGLGRGMDR